MIDIAVLRAAGLSQDQILKVLETEQTEQKLKIQEQNRIKSRRYREKIRNEINERVTNLDSVTRDGVMPPQAKKEMSPHTPLKEKNSTPLPSTSCSAAPPVRDIRDELFKHGLLLLAAITGKTPDSCRSLVGKMLKAVDDEAIHVLGAIEDAERNHIADPVPWIWAVLNNHKKPNGGLNGYHHPQRKSAADVARELVENSRREASFDFDRVLPESRRIRS